MKKRKIYQIHQTQQRKKGAHKKRDERDYMKEGEKER